MSNLQISGYVTPFYVFQKPEGRLNQHTDVDFFTNVPEAEAPKFLRTKNTLTKMGERS